MTSTTEKKPPKLIHIARIQGKTPQPRYLFLKQLDPHTYTWFEEDDKDTGVSAATIEEAIRLARRTWKDSGFRTVICGFRYTLPERDEHGGNAFFFQMVASLSSMNGVYFDEELGHNCLVQGASNEAKELWQKLRNRQ